MKILCKIFGHKWEKYSGKIVRYEYIECKKMNNGCPNYGKTKTKRKKKNRIIKYYKKCERCCLIKSYYK